ncbi:MAG: ADP-specific phosphofructokinase [Methanosaeta sp. PtaU1.Bin112]|nr:MAG: ADP-specific phosphofructokinase [Methanosaeta sp. PtaU1.Bin112]
MNIICAYTANVDAVCNIWVEGISRLLPADMKIELVQSIGSLEDLQSCLLFCLKHGSGAEILIENEAVALQIEESFSWQYRLGGNGAIMANVLAALGENPILNAPAMGPKLAEMLHARVCVPDGQSSELVCEAARNRADRGEAQKDDQNAIQDDEKEMVHFVFQFKKGDSISLGKSSIIAPKDNRFIATYDTVNTKLLTSRNFDSYCLENIRDINAALLSGFHLAPLDDYEDIFTQRIAQIRSWKERNPQIFIHAEMGSFQSPEIMQSLLLHLSKIPVDSLGLNEDELAASEGLKAGSSLSSWQDSMRSAIRLRESLGIFRVAVHTRDYILSVMQQGKIAAREELFALQKGVEAAAALAATGLAAAQPPNEISPQGLEGVVEFCCKGAAASGRGAFLHQGDTIISLIPSLLVKQPKITVGLGDTATATIFFQELMAIKEKSVWFTRN